MAKAEVFTLNDTTPTLVFEGQGTVVFQTGQAVLLGGADVSLSASIFANSLNGHPMRVESRDKIYALAYPGETNTIKVFSCR